MAYSAGTEQLYTSAHMQMIQVETRVGRHE
jgi:hypothetical protein